MPLNLKSVNLFAVILLAAALVTAVGFVAYGVRIELSAWYILGIVGSIFNTLLLVYSLIGPLRSVHDLRYALLFLSVEAWFFIAGAFAIGDGWLKTAWICTSVGVLLHVLVTGRRLRRIITRKPVTSCFRD